MWLRTLFDSMKQRRAGTPVRRTLRQQTAARLQLEALEDRVVPAFLEAVNYAAGVGPEAVVAADLNNDAVLDLAVANHGTVSVQLGNGDGTFRPAISTPAPWASSSLAVGDFNADGKLDLAIGYGDNLSNYSGGVYVLLGNGNGGFQTPTGNDLYGTSGESVAVGDFNGDGKLDIADVANYIYVYYDEYGYEYTYEESYLIVFPGTGTGTFGEPMSSSPVGGVRTFAAIADFNADGKVDIASGYYGYAAYIDVAFGTGTGWFLPSVLTDAGFSSYSVAAADVNNDGKVDLAMANYYDGSVSVLLGNGLGSFGSPQSYDAGGHPDSLATADFNADGKLDLITTNEDSETVSVLLGAGAGAFKPPVTAAVGLYPSDVAVGDFNGDGLIDAAAANSTDGGNVSVLLNDGIWDTTPWPTVTINGVTLTEGNTGSKTATFTVTLSAASGETVTVDFATADGTATAGSGDYQGDYQAASGTLAFAPGETSKTITVAVFGDHYAEPNERFSVNLSGATNAAIAVHQGHATVLDDDPHVSITDVTRSEGNTGQTPFAFTVTLSTAYDVPVAVDWATADGTATAGSNYQAQSGTLTFAQGETSKTITILVNGDRLPEPNKTFFVNLSNLNYGAIADSQGAGTILDDEPRISISNVVKRESRKNATSFVFTVTLSAVYDQAVTVSYKTTDGTATTGDNDYVAQTGTLTFAPGETTKSITIEVNGDSKREADETLYLDLFGISSNSLFTKNRGIGSILNDD